MAKRPTATGLKPTPLAPLARAKGMADIARAAGLLPEAQTSKGRYQEDDDELLLGVARLMLSPTPPGSLSAAIAIVLDTFIEQRKGPKKDWRVRLHGKWVVYKGAEQRLRDRYQEAQEVLKKRVIPLEAFRAGMESRIASVATPDGKALPSMRPLSSKQLEHLRAWKGELPTAQDLERRVEIVRAIAESVVKKKASAVR